MSLVWFEHVKRFWNMNPTRFTFGLMTRSKAITYDNLALRAPEFVAEVDRWSRDETKAHGFDVDTKTPVAPMFQPFRLRDMTLAEPRRGLADVPVFGARTACRTTGISCITAAAPSAAPAWSSPR